MKLLLGPLEHCVHRCRKRWDKEQKAQSQRHFGPSPTHEHGKHMTPKKSDGKLMKPVNSLSATKKEARKEGRLAIIQAILFQHGKSAMQMMMPGLILVAFTMCEMVSVALANYALNLTPTSIFVVFKSSKMVFVAVASRLFLGARLRTAQWAALFFMSL